MSRRRIALLVMGTLFAVLAIGKGIGWILPSDGVEVTVRDLSLGATVEGALEAVESVRLGPTSVEGVWRYRISRLTPEGTEVKVGEPLVVFDTTELDRRLVEATTEAATAAKQVEKIRTDLDVERRTLELQLEEAQGRLRQAELKAAVDEGVTAKSDLEKAAIELELARREIEYLESSADLLVARTRLEIELNESQRELANELVERLRRDIEAMTVRAPRDGTLLWRPNRRGDKREVGDTVWRTDTVVEIPDLTRMRAQVTVDEAQAGRIAHGQPVELRLDAFPDRQYNGRVEQVRRAVQRRSRDDPTKVVQVRVDLAETDTERMRPGMRVRGTVVIDTADDALTVPTDAVYSDASGAFVLVETLFGTQRVHAEFGRRNAEYIEVLSGLSPGDRVVLTSEDREEPL